LVLVVLVVHLVEQEELLAQIRLFLEQGLPL
jgi:hypothetical protein